MLDMLARCLRRDECVGHVSVLLQGFAINQSAEQAAHKTSCDRLGSALLASSVDRRVDVDAGA